MLLDFFQQGIHITTQGLGEHDQVFCLCLVDQYGYGNIIKQNYNTAIEWYSKAAELKNSDAMVVLGIMYSEGLGVEIDKEKAEKLWQQAGEALQSTEISDIYIDVDSDRMAFREVALELLHKAADAGMSTAMSNIGYWGYRKGYKGLNEEKARIWYEKAIDKGNPTAMANLGFSYYRSGNYDSAMEWLLKAYANGADYVADDINNMLTKKQGVNAYFENYGELISAKS